MGLPICRGPDLGFLLLLLWGDCYGDANLQGPCFMIVITAVMGRL